MYCDKCGSQITDDSEFCGYCGTTLGTVTAEMPKPPIPPGSESVTAPLGVTEPSLNSPQEGPPTGQPFQPYSAAQPPRRPWLPWALGGLGLTVIVAVALILVFVVFKGGESDTSGPEQVVETLFRALETRNADMLLGTMDPTTRSSIEDALGQDYERIFEYYFLLASPENLKVTIESMDTVIDRDKASVTTEGTMTYTDNYWDEVKDRVSESTLDVAELVKVSGEWYLSDDTLEEAGFDPSELEDLNLALPIDSSAEAYLALRRDAEIDDWFQNAAVPLFSVTDENGRYTFYLYEIDRSGEEIPFWWFGVLKKSGEVFEITND